MPINKLTDQEERQLENSFTYHPPVGDQPDRYIEIRSAAKVLVRTIMECAPHSRERSIAITQIELGVAMANKAIACNE
jgi:hypothetical protein